MSNKHTTLIGLFFLFISHNIQAQFSNIDLASIKFEDKAENLGTIINSQYDELHPIIAPDGKTLYFNRHDHPENIGSDNREDVWYAPLNDNNEWGKALNMGTGINSEGHNFICGILPDGNTALVAGTYAPEDTDGKDKLFLVKRSSDGWGAPKELEIQHYYNLTTSNTFHLGASGKILLLALVRKDSYPMHDLYVSFLLPSGVWSAPKNLGYNINTRSIEYSPFLAPDGKTLYFSSAGHSGLGSTDIFVSKRLDDTWQKWSKPKNLGPKINTSDYDGYFSIDAAGEYAYFSSHNNTYGKGDIFRIKIAKPDTTAITTNHLSPPPLKTKQLLKPLY